MIGLGREFLFYEMLQSRWYAAIGVTQKRAEKVRSALLRGTITEATVCKYVELLGYKQVRPSFVVAAVYKRHGMYCDERTALVTVTSVRGWWIGKLNKAAALNVRVSVRRAAELSEPTVDYVLTLFGYERVRPRVVLPSIYEKPSPTSARAYTKRDILDSVIADAYEYKSNNGSARYRALPYAAKR